MFTLLERFFCKNTTTPKITNSNNNRKKIYLNKLTIASNKRTFSNKNNNKRLKTRKCKFFNNDDKDIKRINEDLLSDNINEIKVLSRPRQSLSNSIVIYTTDKQNYGYVYKISGKTASVKKEAEIYEKLNQLIFHKVTPHLFLTFGSGKVTIPENTTLYNLINEINSRPINKNTDIHPMNYLDLTKDLYCLINETGPDTTRIIPYFKLFNPDKGKHLHDYFFSMEYFKPNRYETQNRVYQQLNDWSKLKNFFRVIYNLTFQFKWTFYVFRLISFYHQDTHFGNVMLIFNKKNVFENPDEFEPDKVKYKSYTFTHEGQEKTYYLEDLGIDLQIFDFDDAYFSNEETVFRLSLDGEKIENNFINIMQNAGRESTLHNKEDITKNDFAIICTNITRIHYYLNIYNSSIQDAKRPKISSFDDYMNNYLGIVFPYIPYLKTYKYNHMLVSNDVNTHFSTLKGLYDKLDNEETEKAILVDNLDKPTPDIDSIKERTVASYSTKSLIPQKNSHKISI